MFARISIGVPSAECVGPERARSFRETSRSASESRRSRKRATTASEGSRQTTPSRPSTTTRSPSPTCVRSPCTATTAGRPNERARIAACEVLPPRSVTKAITRSRGMRTASEGVSSSATRTMASPARSLIFTRDCSSPPRCRLRTRETSSRSAARSRRLSSGRLRKRATRSSVVWETAHSAFAASCAMRRSTGPTNALSCRKSACAWKIPAYSEPRRSFTWRAVSSISATAACAALR